MKYKYNGKIYDEELLTEYNDIMDLLFDLEEQEDIEVQSIEVYSVKHCDGFYTDDEIDEFLEELSDMEIIEEIKE